MVPRSQRCAANLRGKARATHLSRYTRASSRTLAVEMALNAHANRGLRACRIDARLKNREWPHGWRRRWAVRVAQAPGWARVEEPRSATWHARHGPHHCAHGQQTVDERLVCLRADIGKWHRVQWKRPQRTVWLRDPAPAVPTDQATVAVPGGLVADGWCIPPREVEVGPFGGPQRATRRGTPSGKIPATPHHSGTQQQPTGRREHRKGTTAWVAGSGGVGDVHSRG